MIVAFFGFPAPGADIANPTFEDYTKAKNLLKQSASFAAADQAAVRQFCGDVMLAVHPDLQITMAVALAPLSDQVAAMQAAMADQAAATQAAMADQAAATQAAMADQAAAIAAMQAAMADQAAATQAAMADQAAAMQAAMQAAMADQAAAMQAAMGAQLAAMGAQVVVLPDMILARQLASSARRAHSEMGVDDILMKLPCERNHVNFPLDIEPPSVLCGYILWRHASRHAIFLSICLSVTTYHISVPRPARFLNHFCPPPPSLLSF